MLDLANAGYVDVAAVGNEVMCCEELEEEELIEHILRAKLALHRMPVGANEQRKIYGATRP